MHDTLRLSNPFQQNGTVGCLNPPPSSRANHPERRMTPPTSLSCTSRKEIFKDWRSV